MEFQELDEIIELAAIQINEAMKREATEETPKAEILNTIIATASDNPNTLSPVIPDCRIALLKLVQIRFPN